MSAPVTAPWIFAQATQLLAQRGHAWLLAGPSGLGQYSLALALVRAWLCNAPTPDGACGTCSSCHAIDVHTHADLCVLMPETVMLALGWPLQEKAQSDIDDKKRKPSKEIRVDAMRDAVEFSQRTSARGGAKAVLVFPAERMNNITANALLKTLEEPPGDVKFVLATDAAHQLLPTIRSRCLGHSMLWPSAEESLTWLLGRGVAVDEARVILRAAGGRPEDALLYCQGGPAGKAFAAAWVRLPSAMSQGDGSILKDWTPAEVVDALHKLCHDMLALKMGACARFFVDSDLPPGGTLNSLTVWSRALGAARRTVEHPFNAGLMVEALVAQAHTALNSN